MKNRIGIFATLIVIFLALSQGRALAAFVVTPMEFHLDVSGNEEATYTFYVRNKGDETISLKLYTGDFWIEPDGKERFLEPGEIERSCAQWLELAPEELELAPDESKAVRFKITVPPEKIGTYWAMIFIEQTTKPTIKTAERGEQKFNILSFQRVGVRVFENTVQGETGKGRINEINAGWNKEKGLLEIDLRFENESEVLLRCKGTVEIKDMMGETVTSVELGEFNCYPKAERIKSSFIEEKLAPGQYTTLAIVDYGAEYLVAGEAVFEVNGE